MARTMAANLTGARLREVDQGLRDARGGAAVDALMKAHPHEAKVLQHLFDERRAGRPAPPLMRIARVMIWSDGAMEFRLVDSPTPMGGLPVGPVTPSTPSMGRPDQGQRGQTTVPRGPGFGGSVGRPSGRPNDSLGAPRSGGNERPRGDQRQGTSGSQGAGPPRLRTAWVGGTRLDPAPRQFRRRPGEDDDVNWPNTPRVGEGWSVIRPGDVSPIDSDRPTAMVADAEVEAQAPTVDSVATDVVPETFEIDPYLTVDGPEADALEVTLNAEAASARPGDSTVLPIVGDNATMVGHPAALSSTGEHPEPGHPDTAQEVDTGVMAPLQVAGGDPDGATGLQSPKAASLPEHLGEGGE